MRKLTIIGAVIRKNLHLLIVLFALLFNIQVGLTHSVEHVFHASDIENTNESEEIENCLLKSNVTKSNDLSSNYQHQISNQELYCDYYSLSNQNSFRFFAYQSQAP